MHTPLQTKPELTVKYEHKIDSIGLNRETMEASDRAWIRGAAPQGRFVERILQGHATYTGTNVYKMARFGIGQESKRWIPIRDLSSVMIEKTI